MLQISKKCSNIFIEKNPCISGPTQFKPALFKCQLYIQIPRNKFLEDLKFFEIAESNELMSICNFNLLLNYFPYSLFFCTLPNSRRHQTLIVTYMKYKTSAFMQLYICLSHLHFPFKESVLSFFHFSFVLLTLFSYRSF